MIPHNTVMDVWLYNYYNIKLLITKIIIKYYKQW